MFGIFGVSSNRAASATSSDNGTHARLDTANAELVQVDNDLNTGLGADGASGPASGSGVRGWLHNIRDLLAGTIAVSASSLPLPIGASTASNQSTGNTSLAGIATSVAGVLDTQKQRGGSSALTNPTVTSSSSTALSANANRLEAIIVNNSAVTMYIKQGTTASSSSFNVMLAAGGTYIEDVYTGRIDFILASGSATCAVTEVTV